MLDLQNVTLNPSYESSHTPTSADFALVESYLPRRAQPCAFSAQLSAERQIADFSDMQAGWDGHDAVPIAAAVGYNSLLALQSILSHAPLQDITPNPNGTISFEWDTDFGFAALEVGQSRISFFVKSQTGSALFLDGTANDLPTIAIKAGIMVADTLFPSHNTAEPITRILAPPYVLHTP